MAGEAPGYHAEGHLGGLAGRSQRECGLSVQQEASAGNRSSGALHTQAPGRHEGGSYAPEQEGRVFFGAWVEVENEAAEIKRFRIVGYDEIYLRKDYISIDSPMARALLKKEVGDEAVVHTPAGETCWWINQIDYVK